MDEKKDNSTNRKSDSDIAYAMIMKMKALNARKVLDQSSAGDAEAENDIASEIIAPENQNTEKAPSETSAVDFRNGFGEQAAPKVAEAMAIDKTVAL